MSPSLPASIVKNKKRRILIISAGGIQSGVQALYIGMENGAWSIFSKAFVPYPQKVGLLIGLLNETQEPVKLSEIGWLEYKITMLLLESANAALAQAPKVVGRPDLILLNKITLWKGPTGEDLQQSSWDLSIGDAKFVANSLDTPVLSDFIRHNILAGGPGVLPTSSGSLKIASAAPPGLALFLNIGLVSRMTMIDNNTSSIVIESDTGPGTILTDICAKEANCPEGFDRDGSVSSKGTVNTECLQLLSSQDWFRKPAPKHSSADFFISLLQNERVRNLDPIDRLATITALTAKTAYDFYKRECGVIADAIWISGGGSNNLALKEYLAAYFDPIPVRSVEELGVPSDMQVPLTLGLTVDAFLSGESVPWESGRNPLIKPVGRWILPQE